MNINEIVRISNIPSMCDWNIGLLLYHAARNMQGKGSVVQCGAWFGAGTGLIINGLKDAGLNVPVHCYDRWRVNQEEVDKAEKYKVTVEPGQSILMRFLDSQPEYDNLNVYQDEIQNSVWCGENIELYVDDANKKEEWWLSAMERYAPCFIPGETLLVLMDYFFYEVKPAGAIRQTLAGQTRWYKRNQDKLKYLGRVGNGSQTALFRVTGSFKENP